MQPVEWRAERAPVPLAHRVDRDRVAVAAVAMNELGGLRRQPGQVIAQSELLQHAGRVRGQRDAGAHLTQLGGLLEDFGGDAPAAQQQRQGKSAHPRSDDHDPDSRRGHRDSLHVSGLAPDSGCR